MSERSYLMKKRVLVLDWLPPEVVFEAKKHGVDVDWRCNVLLLQPLAYEDAIPAEVQQIRQITSEHVDAIIIGNNVGAGVSRAREIRPEMRDKTMIVWNDYCPGNEAPYAALGFQYFGSRDDIDVFLKMLGVRNLDDELQPSSETGRES